MKKILLSRPQIIKLSRLLYMKYKPSEIAKVLDVDVHTVYQNYLKIGCPFEKDTNGNIWIIGTDFREWAQSEIAERKKKVNPPMLENQAWCVKCNERVLMVNPKVVYSGGNREILQSICPLCGTKVNRARGIR
ncbi:MAG: hypothetical protein C0401_05890 [Anaerolinea sp.]|nr:hypothetical protein [Anaerolinea sp.]